MSIGCDRCRQLDDCCFFFFNDTATTEIYTLSLHDALPISGKKPKNRHLNPNHSEKGQETRKDEQQKSKTKDVKNGKKEASNKSKKGAVKKKRVLQSFDFNKLKKIDIGTQEFGKTEKKEKGGKNGFVYTPRKLKNNNRRKKDFNEKIVNRIKKITTKYGHQH